MVHYYTTRFNPAQWPPVGGAVPPGVEWSEAEWRGRGAACCDAAELRVAATSAPGEPWVYRTVYRVACGTHGEAVCAVESRLDWISPHEYLLLHSVPDQAVERTTE